MSGAHSVKRHLDVEADAYDVQIQRFIPHYDLDRKTDLYRSILTALTPGGVFLNLDAAVSEDPRVNRLVFDRWAAHLGAHGIPDADARGHFAAWSDEDRYFPLDAELKALRDAGFASAPSVPESWLYGVLPDVRRCSRSNSVYCGPRSSCVAPSKCGDQGCAELVQTSTAGLSHDASSSDPALMKATSGSGAAML
jgi:hypothetical protein